MFDFEILRSLPDFTDVKRRIEQLVFNKQGKYQFDRLLSDCKILFVPVLPLDLIRSTVSNAVADMCRLDQLFVNSNYCYQLGSIVPNHNPDPYCPICLATNDLGYFMRTRRARTSDMDRSHHRKVLGLFCQKCIESYDEIVRGKYKYVSYSNYRVTMED